MRIIEVKKLFLCPRTVLPAYMCASCEGKLQIQDADFIITWQLPRKFESFGRLTGGVNHIFLLSNLAALFADSPPQDSHQHIYKC